MQSRPQIHLWANLVIIHDLDYPLGTVPALIVPSLHAFCLQGYSPSPSENPVQNLLFASISILCCDTCTMLLFPCSILCPEEESPYPITFWMVMSKVRLEAFMWGAGTAIGELPPYFMARAGEHTLSLGSLVPRPHPLGPGYKART